MAQSTRHGRQARLHEGKCKVKGRAMGSRAAQVAAKGVRGLVALMLATSLGALLPVSALAEEPSQSDVNAVSQELSEGVQSLMSRLVFVGDQIYRIDPDAAYLPQLVDTAELPVAYVAPHTSVKDQGVFETCWSFGALAAFESAQRVQKGAMGSEDLSTLFVSSDDSSSIKPSAPTSPDYAEVPVVYSVFHPRLDASGNPDPTCSYAYPAADDTFDGFATGGSWYHVSSALAQWRGVVDQSKAPYIPLEASATNEEKQAAVQEMCASARAVNGISDVHLENSEIMSSLAPILSSGSAGQGAVRTISAAARDRVKQQMMERGALSINVSTGDLEAGASIISVEEEDPSASPKEYRIVIDEDESVAYPDKNLFWHPGADAKGQFADHCVTLVGWDDTYSRFNFARQYTDGEAYDTDVAELAKATFTLEGGGATPSFDALVPKEDGAWIIKNSWGTEHGKQGYMWVSYLDKTLDGAASFLPDQQSSGTHTYSTAYSYDECLAMCIDISEGTHAANVFTAKGDELVQAVGIWTSSNSTVTARVYANMADPVNPESGTLQATVRREFSNAGFYTVPLPNSVQVAKDSLFSVVVDTQVVESGASKAEIPVEAGLKDAGFIYTAEGQSFVKTNSTSWVDIKQAELPEDTEIDTGNVAVKAFTVADPSPVPPTPPTPDPPSPDPQPSPTPAEHETGSGGHSATSVAKTSDSAAAGAAAAAATSALAIAALAAAVHAQRRRQR